MKWKQGPWDHFGRCGHLYVRIEAHSETEFSWFIEPDNEDKSYRRALVEGNAASLDEAKSQVLKACGKLVRAMQRDMLEDVHA
jgi:hypothetical protein